ncbi:MAG: alpha-ribazole phosphatase family protein, partial [Pseudomonadota bacterium]
MALILVRHTTPAVALGICYGQTDLDVRESFPEEAQAVSDALPKFDRIVTSPLQRCRKLADAMAKASGFPVEQDPRLIEMDFGSWEGTPWSDIPRAELDAWAADFLNARPHGGESVAVLRARTMEALSDWRDRGSEPLIVT